MAKLWFVGYSTGLQAERLRRQQFWATQDDPKALIMRSFSDKLIVDSSDVKILEYLNESEWEDKFIVFYLSVLSSLHWSIHTIAINFNGTIYRLAGFDEIDLDSLIQNEFVGNNNNALLISAASFIAKNANTDPIKSNIIVDSSNISLYKQSYSGLYTPSIEPVMHLVYSHELS